MSPDTDPLGGARRAPAPPPRKSECAFACFVNPLIAQNNQYTSAASSLYEGLILEAKKRFSDHFTMFGNYTFSKGFDTTTDFNTDYSPQDPDRAVTGSWAFGVRRTAQGGPGRGLRQPLEERDSCRDSKLSPIFSYHSGLPFNLLVGGEVNGNNHITNERPLGSPRDTGLGPNFTNFDMRLSWRHKIGEKASVTLTAEGFNIANHTNFASVNNEVNPLYGIETAQGLCPTSGQCATGNTSFNVHGMRPGTALPDGDTVSPSTAVGFHFGLCQAPGAARSAVHVLVRDESLAWTARRDEPSAAGLDLRRSTRDTSGPRPGFAADVCFRPPATFALC